MVPLAGTEYMFEAVCRLLTIVSLSNRLFAHLSSTVRGSVLLSTSKWTAKWTAKHGRAE